MRMRKLVSIVLTVAMTIALAVPAFAAASPRHRGQGGSGGAQDPRSGTIIDGSGSSTATKGVGTGTIGPDGSIGTVYYGWHYVPEVDKWWYEYNDRTWAVGWAKLYWKPANAETGYEAWYHFDSNGWMDTGWFTDADTNAYYLHPYADGTRGYMYTGTHNLGGQNYSFEETAGQKQGHLLR